MKVNILYLMLTLNLCLAQGEKNIQDKPFTVIKNHPMIPSFSEKLGFVSKLDECQINFLSREKIYDKGAQIYSMSDTSKMFIYNNNGRTLAVYHSSLPEKYEILKVEEFELHEEKYNKALIELKIKNKIFILFFDLINYKIIYYKEK